MEVRVAEADGVAAGAGGEFDDALRGEERIEEAVAGAEVQESPGGRRGFGGVDLRRAGPGGVAGLVFARAEPEVVPAEDGVAPMPGADLVDGGGKLRQACVVFRRLDERKVGKGGAGVEIRELEGNEAEADAALPGFFQEVGEAGVGERLDGDGLVEAVAAAGFLEIAVADADGDCAGGARCGAELGEEAVGHRAEGREGEGFVGGVGLEGLLFGEGFRGRGVGHHGAVVDAVGEFPERACGFSGEEGEVGGRCGGDVADEREAGAAEGVGEAGANAWQPFDRERGEELSLGAGGDFDKGVGFFRFAGDLGGEFVRGHAFGEGDAEGLVDGAADGGGGVPGVAAFPAAEVGVALVDRPDLDERREIVGVAEHEAREVLVFFEVARDNDEARAEPAGARNRHGGGDAVPAGLVGGRGHHPARRTAHGHGLPPQARVGRLLDRGEKGVGIEVEDHGVQMNTFLGWNHALSAATRKLLESKHQVPSQARQAGGGDGPSDGHAEFAEGGE